MSEKKARDRTVSRSGHRGPPRSRRDAVAEGAERVARGFVIAAVFFVPVAFDRRTIDVFNLAKITLLWVLVIAALGAWVFAVYVAPRGRRPARSSILRNAAVLLGVTALATVLSTNRRLSFVGSYDRYEGLASLILYVGLAVLIFILYHRRSEDLRHLALAIGAAAVATSIYVIAQRAGLDPFRWTYQAGRAPLAFGTLGNNDFASSYIGIGVPFFAYLAITEKSRVRRIAWLVAIAVSLTAIVMTQGRGGMLAALTGVLALATFTVRASARAKAGVIAVAFGLLALVPFVTGRLPANSQNGVLRTDTVVYRAQMWDAGMHMFFKRPVIGWGPEAYYGNFPRFRSSDDAQRNELLIPDKPHNIFVNWAVSTGIAGLVAYLMLVAGALRLVIVRGSTLEGPARHLANAFGAGLVAYLAQGMFSIDVPPLAMAGWVTVGSIAAIFHANTASDRKSASAQKRDPGNRPQVPWFVQSYVPLAAISIALAVLIVLGVQPLRADHAAWTAAQQPWNAVLLYQKARQLNPSEAAYDGLEASYFETVANDPASQLGSTNALERSAGLWEQAVGVQPRNLTFLLGAARVYTRLGATTGDASYFAAGDRWLAQVARLDPRDPKVHEIYADFLQQWSRRALVPADRDRLERQASTEAAIAQTLRVRR